MTLTKKEVAFNYIRTFFLWNIHFRMAKEVNMHREYIDLKEHFLLMIYKEKSLRLT